MYNDEYVTKADKRSVKGKLPKFKDGHKVHNKKNVRPRPSRKSDEEASD